MRPKSPYDARDLPLAEFSTFTRLPHPLEGWIAGEDSRSARALQIVEGERVLAQALATPAEQSTLISGLGVTAGPLEKCMLVSDVSFAPDLPASLVAPLLYLVLRRARIVERPMLLAATSKTDGAEVALLDLQPLPRLGTLDVAGASFFPLAQRVDISIHRAFSQTSETMLPFLREQFVPEAVETLDRWVARFFQTPFFRTIFDGTITKEQYVYAMSNIHQFVRWTTRLIGLAISHSSHKVIRHKWIEHLREEVDHEVIIEKDLATLGVDVDYIVKTMLPNVSTQQFMVAQESTIAFHNDPVTFMASPFAAEGFTARLDRRFSEALRRAAQSWGVANPKKCTAFWASHLEFDGGDDGHYEHSRAVLDHYLETDTDLLRFLNAARLAMRAMEESYTSYIEDLAIFGATPSK